MRGRAVGIAAGVGLALTIAGASVPWSLDPERVAERLNGVVAPYGYHWERPGAATLRLFPQPILDVYPLTLDDADGKPVLTVSTAAAQLSITDLLHGRYVLQRARLKEAKGDLDLDAFMATLPSLVRTPPVALLRVRGGTLRLHSARLDVKEAVAPLNLSWTWDGPDEPLHATLGGSWRGRQTQVEVTVDAPADFLEGRVSGMRLIVTTEGATATIDGDARLGAEPSFSGKISAKVDSLARTAAWVGLDLPGLPDEGAGVTGVASAAPGLLNFEDGALTYRGQNFEGAAGFQKGAKGWTATATLAAERLDLAPFFGPAPRWLGADGWSRAPILPALPPLDLDLRLSAESLTWGDAKLSDAAVAVTRRGDEMALKILEAGFAGGALNGDVVVRDCAGRCALRATLALVNAAAEKVTAAVGRRVATGVAAIDVDVTASGDTPAELVASAEGELGLTVRDGAILGVNFEEAMRRSQRRTIDPARDLLVGQTAFRKLEAKFDFANGIANARDARMNGPGVAVTAAGAIDFQAQRLVLSLESRQADALGHVSPGGAALGLTAKGPWAAPAIELTTSPN